MTFPFISIINRPFRVIQAPTSFQVNRVGGYNRMLATWVDGAASTATIIERSLDGSTGWTQVAAVNFGVEQFQDGNLVPGIAYFYRAYSTNGSADSGYTANDSDTIYDPVDDATIQLVLESDSGLLQTSGGSAAVADGDPVGEWQDRSGVSSDFGQATGLDRPSLQTVKGAKVVRFAADFLESPDAWTSLHNGTDYTIALTFRTTDGADAVYGLFGNNGGSSINRGVSAFWDNQSASPAYNQINHKVGNGTTPVYSLVRNGVVYDQEWVTLFLNFDGAIGEQYCMGDSTGVSIINAVSGSASLYSFQLGACGNDAYPTNIDVVGFHIWNEIRTVDQMQDFTDYINGKFPTLFGMNYDPLIVDLQVEYSTLASAIIDSPARYVSNPVLPTAGTNVDTWDHDKNYGAVVKVDDTHYYMWYWGIDEDANYCECYAESSDGFTWTKPNLGLHTYDGNTNNNIMLINNYQSCAVVRSTELPVDQEYLLLTSYNSVGASGTFLHKGSDRTTWTYLGAIVTSGDSNHAHELHSAVYDPYHQNVIAYVSNGHGSELRTIHAHRSNQRYNADGGWHYADRQIAVADSDHQNYSCNVFFADGWFYMLSDIYNNTSEEIWRTDLYVSRNGLHWVLAKEGVFTLEAGEHMLLSYTGMMPIGEDWILSLSISPFYHDHFLIGLPDDNRVNLASVPRGRFGGRGLNGILVTQPMYLTEDSIVVNVDASGGSLIAEVLDEAGNVITGFSQAEFVTITADSKTASLIWADQYAPLNQIIRIRFILSNATLYQYRSEPQSHIPYNLTDQAGNRLTDQAGNYLTA